MSNCECVSCEECGGVGDIWFSFTGKYLGKNRCDDLDRCEGCDSCQATGVVEVCDYCREMQEQDLDCREYPS